MQSTEDEARTPETIIHEAETAIWKDSEYFTAEDVFVLAKALAAERDRADRWAAQVAAIEKVLDHHAFDDEDGNGFVPIGPLQDVLFGKKVPG